MGITFNSIPDNLRVPGNYFEFDPSKANSGQFMQKLLVLGQRLNTGSVAAGEPVTVTREEQGGDFFGRGSMLEHTLKFVFKARPSVEVVVIASDDNAAGQQATGSISITGASDISGTLQVTVAGERVQVAVIKDGTQDDIASSVVAAINAQTDFPVNAAVNGGNANQVDVTARHKGECGNDLPISVKFLTSAQPASPAFAVVAMNGGGGNPDIADSIAAWGDEWYNWIICPWTDDANLTALEAELRDRYGPTRQIGCRAFIAKPDTFGTVAAFGDGRNCEHVNCIGTGKASQPPYLWAAVAATTCANSLAIDPSRQLSTLILPGIEPPAPADRFTFTERNLLLWDGISTYTVDAGGQVRIEAMITMYQENSQGLADDSMLYLNVPELYDRYRYEQRLLFAPHARDKFADDGNNLPAGQPIMTPKKARAMLHVWYSEMISDKAWCEDLDHYKETLLVEKEGNRLKVVDQPNFIDNLRQVFGRSELIAN